MNWLARLIGLSGDTKTAQGTIRDVKGEVSPQLMSIPEVSGLGQQGDTLTVYLKTDSDRTRHQVERVVKNVAPSAQVAFRISGGFRAHAA